MTKRSICQVLKLFEEIEIRMAAMVGAFVSISDAISTTNYDMICVPKS